jgi:hypothetical protein
MMELVYLTRRPTVLSAVGVNPDGVRRRWRFDVAIAVAPSDARTKSVELPIAIVGRRQFE